MGSMIGNKFGLAGEFRVMSELLLRGYNPAKSYLAEGADKILQNSLRIEVKSSHRHFYKKNSKRHEYFFSLKGGNRSKVQNCDYVILWCINDDCFFIIPAEIANVPGITITDIDNSKKYIPYKNKWELLEIK